MKLCHKFIVSGCFISLWAGFCAQAQEVPAVVPDSLITIGYTVGREILWRPFMVKCRA